MIAASFGYASKPRLAQHSREGSAARAGPLIAGLRYFTYNFIKIHRTLRMAPAMAAGLTDRLWEVSDLIALIEA
jgi:hypothetical protein